MVLEARKPKFHVGYAKRKTKVSSSNINGTLLSLTLL